MALGIPVGSPAFRFHLLVAGAAAGAALVLGLLTSALSRPMAPSRVAIAAGVFAGGVWGLSDTFWWEAVIGDKYGPYYLAYASLLACALWPRDGGRGRGFLVLGLLIGVAVAHHQYAIFAFPAVLVALRLAHASGGPEPSARAYRRVLLMAVLAALPYSTKGMYPPLRSAGGAELDWGRPATAGRLITYAQAKLYHQAFAASSLPKRPEALTERLGLAVRLLLEEIPLPLLVGLPVGVAVLARRAGGSAIGLVACLLFNAAFMVNFTEKIVRWYEPSYAVLACLAAIGLAWCAGRLRALGPVAMACVAVVAVAWQGQRGAARNDLSRFTAAHDFARHLFRSLPEGSVYLGAGDFDLFPMWASRYTEDMRPDVEAVGLAAFVSPYLAGGGGMERVRRRLGGEVAPGTDMLRALLETPGAPPLMVASAGYDRRLYALMPFLRVVRYRGLAARLIPHWDAAGSADATARVSRTYTYRGLLYGSAGALGDLDRLRDEVARGALLHYPGSLTMLGSLCWRFGLIEESARAFGLAARMMDRLTGVREPTVTAPFPAGWRVPPPPGARWTAAARAARSATALGYHRMADAFEARGVTALGAQIRANAVAAAP